jgi:acyl-CoA thioester hydrolase
VTHVTTLRVRSYECDSYGHVNNAVYLNYLEYARMTYLRDMGFDMRRFRRLGYGVWVARLDIRFRLPAVAEDELTITTTPVKKGKTSGALQQTVRRGTDTVCEARVTWVCVNPSGRPSRLPEEFDLPGLAAHEPEAESTQWESPHCIEKSDR